MNILALWAVSDPVAWRFGRSWRAWLAYFGLFAACGVIGHGNIGYDAVAVDVDKARAAVGTIAIRLGRGLEQAAEAIIQVAVSGMYREVGKLASRQGIDPRDFTLLAFGGAGPMLGCFLARELGMRQVLIPTAPGVLSALGGLVADVKNDFISTAYYPLSTAELPRLKADFDGLARRAAAWITEEQKFAGPYVLQPAADMRYHGQSFEIDVPLQLDWIAAGDLNQHIDRRILQHIGRVEGQQVGSNLHGATLLNIANQDALQAQLDAGAAGELRLSSDQALRHLRSNRAESDEPHI